MNRNEALELLKSKVKTDWLIKHCLATEAVMRALAVKFGEDADKWGIAAILHDLDFDETADTPEKHTVLTREWLKRSDLPEDSLHAISAHNAEYSGVARESRFDYALTAAETLTGLVVATALVMPDKKLASVKPKSVKKRMKEKSFARKVNRDDIRLCSELDMELIDFIELGVNAMKEIHEDLGL